MLSIWTVFGAGFAFAIIAFILCCLQLLINGNCCAKLRLRREAEIYYYRLKHEAETTWTTEHLISLKAKFVNDSPEIF